MDQNLLARAAEAFSRGADAITEACRLMESAGIPEDKIERLYRALDDVTDALHAKHPPENADDGRQDALGNIFYTPAVILANDAGPDAAGDIRASTAEELREKKIDYPVITGKEPRA